MSEILEYRQELLLPAYEELKRNKLATESEIRDMKKKRDKLEYTLTRKEKTIKSYNEYIVYEKHFLKLLKKREKGKIETELEGHAKQMDSIEIFIKNHIKNLFDQALQIFYAEASLWDNYIKTLIEFKDYSEVSNSYKKMLQYHSDKPEVWLDAIEWERRDVSNTSKVRELSLSAIQRHPTNVDINASFINTLLIEIDNMSTDLVLENNKTSERDIGLRRIEVIYKSSKEKIINLNYLIKILNYLEKYSYTNRIQKLVIEDMMELFATSEETWHTFAIRELNGLSVADVLTEEHQVSKRSLERNIELCCGVYEVAVATLKTRKMWELYIQTMLDLNRDTSTQKLLKRQKLYNALVSAYEADSLSEKNFEIYVSLLRQKKTKNQIIEKVMKKATQLYPHSEDIWKLRIECLAIQNDPLKIYDAFIEGIKLLKKKGYPLWKMLIYYYLTRSDLDHKIIYIYREAIKITDIEEFLEFRIQYLEWTFLTEHIDKTRQLYDEMTLLKPKYYKLHEKMAEFESNQLDPDLDRWRKCYENMIHYFGKDQTDVWINYIKFERDNGDCKNISILYERATRTLNTSLVSKFLSEYTILSIGLM